MLENTEQKLCAARDGDEEALAQVISSFMPAIRANVVGKVCPGLEYDDAVQECMIALFHAVIAYDENRGASFNTFANACIENAAVSAVRSAMRKKHTPLNTAVPLEHEIDSVSKDTQDPQEIFVLNESYSNALQNIENRLSVLERKVLAAFLDGKTYADIACEFNISQKAVDNALQRVRAKLR